LFLAALAFCDWSEMQKTRRDMLLPHTFPRNFSFRFNEMNKIVMDEMKNMLSSMGEAGEKSFAIKPIITAVCANIFAQFFATKKFDMDDPKFQKMIQNFDQIFWEVNQGYAADFLPFLLPFHHNNLKRIERLAHEIREVILETIIGDRYNNWTEGMEQHDYVDSLINHVKYNIKPNFEWETALFALEDIIGGHSAIANFMVKVFGMLVEKPDVQAKIQQEADEILEKEGKTMIELADRNKMPYTESVIMEALRMISSPIVPHVANQNSTIGGKYLFSFYRLANYKTKMNI
jgi:cytochrome P450 family 307 subfamily A